MSIIEFMLNVFNLFKLKSMNFLALKSNLIRIVNFKYYIDLELIPE